LCVRFLKIKPSIAPNTVAPPTPIAHKKTISIFHPNTKKSLATVYETVSNNVNIKMKKTQEENQVYLRLSLCSCAFYLKMLI